MKKIIVGFSRPKKLNILSWLILKIQRTEYSHVYCKFYSETLDRNVIYQASGLQVNFVGEELFKDHCQIIQEFELNVSDEVYKTTLQNSIDKAGYPYSIKQLFHILMYIVTGSKEHFKDDCTGYICAELVAELLIDIEPTFKNADLNLITPKDIYLILKRS